MAAGDPVYTYFEDGSVESMSTFNEKGEKEGVCEVYFRDGSVQVHENYVANEREGLLLEYASNSNILRKRAHYKGGLRDGICETFRETDGSLYIRKTYQMGELLLYEEFYEQGQALKLVLPRDGLYQEFYESGVLMRQVPYVGGEREGLYEEFDETGAKVLEAMYH